MSYLNTKGLVEQDVGRIMLLAKSLTCEELQLYLFISTEIFLHMAAALLGISKTGEGLGLRLAKKVMR